MSATDRTHRPPATVVIAEDACSKGDFQLLDASKSNIFQLVVLIGMVDHHDMDPLQKGMTRLENRAYSRNSVHMQTKVQH